MNDDAPLFGLYVRIIKGGQIAENKGYDPVNRTITVQLQSGERLALARQEVERLSANEETDYLAAKANRKS